MNLFLHASPIDADTGLLIPLKCRERVSCTPFGWLLNPSKFALQVDRWPGAVHKSFTSRSQAERWLAEPITRKFDPILPPSRTSTHFLTKGPVIVVDDDSMLPGSSSNASHRRILPEALTRPLPPVINQGDPQPKRAYMSNTWRDGEKSSKIDTNKGPTLSYEQRAVLDMVKQGRNVFFTGSAGQYYNHFLFSLH